MKIVVAGGTGIIGQALVKDLAGDGHDITILSRNPAGYQREFPDASLEKWDGRTVGEWAKTVNGSDVVVNFAGDNLAGNSYLPERWTKEKKKRIRSSRLESGSAIVKAIAAAEKKPKLLVQSSAIGYYGPRGNEPIYESEPPGEDFVASVAVEWEGCTSEVESMGVRRIILRTGLIQTLEGGPLNRLYLPYKLFGGVYFGSGQQYWSWIHLADEVRAIRFLMDHDSAVGPFNLTAPNPVTCREFGKALGKVMGRPSFMPVPRFAMNLVMGEVATIVFDGQRVIPTKLLDLGFTFRFTDVEEALADIIQ